MESDARQFYRRIYLGFLGGERINKVAFTAEATFWRLIVSADDFGNLPASPRYLLGIAFTHRPEVTEDRLRADLGDLETNGLITRYASEGSEFFHIVGFVETQNAFSKNGVRIRRFPGWPGESQEIPGNPKPSKGNPEKSKSIPGESKKSKSIPSQPEPPPPPEPPPEPEPETEPPPEPSPPIGVVGGSSLRAGLVVSGGGGSDGGFQRRLGMIRMMGFDANDANDYAARLSESEIAEATNAVAKRRGDKSKEALRDKKGYVRGVFERMLKGRNAG